jgi:adenine deaminase
MVLSNGVVSARNGEMLTADAPRDIPSGDSVHIDWARVNLRVGAQGSRLRVIGLVPDQILTVELVLEARIEHGAAVADTERDILKMAVVERHGRSGNVGLGFVKGIGMRRGAMATSVAHDHHNLVLIGVDDESMLSAGRQISRMGGGMAVSVGEHVLAAVPLPIAGLMSDASLVDVRRQIEAAAAAARDLGCSLKDPFMTMSFLSLEVIPSLKLTDRGLVDVERLELVDLWSD